MQGSNFGVKSILATAVVGVVAISGSHASAATVLNDTFTGGSTYNAASYPTPTSTSTGYDSLSGKNLVGSIAPNDLHLAQPATSSGSYEAEALFTAVALAAPLDFVDFTYTFTGTGILNSTSDNANLSIGLFKANGSAPKNDLSQTGLNGTIATNEATGGAQNWVGYIGSLQNITAPASQNRFLARLAQTGTDNRNQEALGLSGGAVAPAPATIGALVSTSSNIGLTTDVYSQELKITLNADGSETLLTNLFDLGPAGSPFATPVTITTNTTTVAAANVLATTYDGLAFGVRDSHNPSSASVLDVSNVLVTTNTPEPASLGAIGLAGLALARRRRSAK